MATDSRSLDGHGPVRRRSLLLGCSGYAVLATVLLTWGDGLPTLVRLPLALPLLLFVPGYAILTALLPGRGETAPRPKTGTPVSGSHMGPMSGLERAIVAVVVSIAVVPIVALLVGLLSGVVLGPILGGVTVVTVVAAGIALVRLPESVSPGDRGRDGGADGAAIDRRHLRDRLTNPITVGAVLLSVLLLASSAAAVVGADDESLRTEFYIVNAAETDGKNASRPGNGDQHVYDLRLKHHGDTRQQYSVVVVAATAGAADGDSESVPRRLGRVSTVVPPNTTVEETYEIPRRSVTGTTTVQFRLYRGPPPATPTLGNAHRVLEVTVDESDQ